MLELPQCHSQNHRITQDGKALEQCRIPDSCLAPGLQQRSPHSCQEQGFKSFKPVLSGLCQAGAVVVQRPRGRGCVGACPGLRAICSLPPGLAKAFSCTENGVRNWYHCSPVSPCRQLKVQSCWICKAAIWSFHSLGPSVSRAPEYCCHSVPGL